jgi:hypothetical protein
MHLRPPSIPDIGGTACVTTVPPPHTPVAHLSRASKNAPDSRLGMRRNCAVAMAESGTRRLDTAFWRAIRNRLPTNAETRVFGCQCRALNLKPWQSPPCRAGDAKPDAEDHRGRLAAWTLRQRLLDAGLSQYEPDPLRAPMREPEHAKWIERQAEARSLTIISTLCDEVAFIVEEQ